MTRQQPDEYSSPLRHFIDQYDGVPGTGGLRERDMIPVPPTKDHAWIAASLLDKVGMYPAERNLKDDMLAASIQYEATKFETAPRSIASVKDAAEVLAKPLVPYVRGAGLALSILRAAGPRAIVDAIRRNEHWIDGTHLEAIRREAEKAAEEQDLLLDYVDTPNDDAEPDDDGTQREQDEFTIVEGPRPNFTRENVVVVPSPAHECTNGKPLVAKSWLSTGVGVARKGWRGWLGQRDCFALPKPEPIRANDRSAITPNDELTNPPEDISLDIQALSLGNNELLDAADGTEDIGYPPDIENDWSDWGS